MAYYNEKLVELQEKMEAIQSSGRKEAEALFRLDDLDSAEGWDTWDLVGGFLRFAD